MGKNAVKLALFEWRIDWFNRILHQLLLLAALLVFSYATYESILDSAGWGLDIIYFTFFVLGFGWLTPKDFQYQKVSSHTYASPVFFMLHKLPIKNSTLIKSRFIIFYINALPILFLFFIGLYFLPVLKDVFTIEGYLAFALMWASIGLSFGAIYPASDLGDRNVTNSKLIFIFIALWIALSILILPTYIIYDDGLINLTIDIANQRPLIVSIISLLIIPVSNWAWIRYAHSKLAKEDFEL